MGQKAYPEGIDIPICAGNTSGQAQERVWSSPAEMAAGRFKRKYTEIRGQGDIEATGYFRSAGRGGVDCQTGRVG